MRNLVLDTFWSDGTAVRCMIDGLHHTTAGGVITAVRLSFPECPLHTNISIFYFLVVYLPVIVIMWHTPLPGAGTAVTATFLRARRMCRHQSGQGTAGRAECLYAACNVCGDTRVCMLRRHCVQPPVEAMKRNSCPRHMASDSPCGGSYVGVRHFSCVSCTVERQKHRDT